MAVIHQMMEENVINWRISRREVLCIHFQHFKELIQVDHNAAGLCALPHPL